MAKSTRGPGAAVKALTALSLAGLLLLFLAMVGVHTDLIDPRTVFEAQTLDAARIVMIVSAVAALVTVGLAIRSAARLPYAAVAALGAWGALGLFLFQDARLASGGASDVTSNVQDPPGYSRLIQARRSDEGAQPTGGPSSCPTVVTLPTQVTPQAAAAALEQSGFVVVGAAAFRAEGTREGYWFGLKHDAVIRIRPGETDIRVTARTPVARGEAACSLAGRLSEALRATS